MLIRIIKGEEKGFTLIELMIVITIIGILAAIAIPQFSSYRARSYNASAGADLRNAATAQEAYYVDHATYASSTSSLIGTNYGLHLSHGVVFSIHSANSATYRMTSYHPSGNASYVIRGPGPSISRF